MHISRQFPIPAPTMDEPLAPSGIRPALVFALFALVALAGTLWLAAHGLAPAAPCLDDPGAVCEPF